MTEQSQQACNSSRNPVVSVITPTYNDSGTLSRAIDSVLNQTYGTFEYIIVDDASTDDTESVVELYDDTRIQYLRHEENKGGSAARNTGIEQAKGKYVAFLDADDEWLPEKLAAQIDCLEGRTNEWVAVYCDRKTQTAEGDRYLTQVINTLLQMIGQTSIEPAARKGGERLIRELLTKRISVGGGSTLMVRTDIAKKIEGFDPSFSRHQDWEFFIRIVKEGKIEFVDNKLCIIHESSNPDPDVVRFAKMRFLGKFIDDVKDIETDGECIVGLHRFELSKLYFEDGNFKKGLQYLVGADIQSIDKFLDICNVVSKSIYKKLINI